MRMPRRRPALPLFMLGIVALCLLAVPTRSQAQTRHTTPLLVTAWVTPSAMSHDAYPTLVARTVPGTRCTADVVYSTGYAPVSFTGNLERANRQGMVKWPWHEETSGTGGRAYVVCRRGQQTQVGLAGFQVR